MVDITHACTLPPRGLDPDMSIIIKKVRRHLPPLAQCYIVYIATPMHGTSV